MAGAKEEASLVDRGGVDSTVGSERRTVLSVVSAVIHCAIGYWGQHQHDQL